MNLVAFVAHPDDCIIYAMPFISHTQKHNWTIIYLTYASQSSRSLEIKKFWSKRNVNTRFLGYKDLNNIDTWDAASVADLLTDLECDILLTHSHEGEYGHNHHKFVNKVTEFLPFPKIYFKTSGQNNFACTNIFSYNLTEVPMHANVIETFLDRNFGQYFVPRETLGDKKWKKLQRMMWEEKLLRIMKHIFSKITSILKI